MITNVQGMLDMDMGTQQASGMKALVGREFGGLLAGRQATNLQVSVLVRRGVNWGLRGRILSEGMVGRKGAGMRGKEVRKRK
jgi:hypothetical protein